MRKTKRPRKALTKRQIRKAVSRGTARANELMGRMKPSFMPPDRELVLG